VAHKFTVGQIVTLMPRVLRSAAAGDYEIRHLMPTTDADQDNPSYRIKSLAEKHERVVPESELTLATGAASVFS
jgi:hypothetical protein